MKNEWSKVINHKALLYYLSTWVVPRGINLIETGISNNALYEYPLIVWWNNGNDLYAETHKIKQLINKITYNFIAKNPWPYWLFLSGWLDSTIVLDSLRNNYTWEIHTITFIYSNTDKETLKLVEFLSKKYNTIHKFIELNEDNIFLLDSIQKNLQNPLVFDYWMVMDHIWLDYFNKLGIKNVLNWMWD